MLCSRYENVHDCVVKMQARLIRILIKKKLIINTSNVCSPM